MNLHEAIRTWEADRPRFEELGVIVPGARAYLPEEFKRNFDLAMDALPTLTTDPNAGVPVWLTMYTDPQIYEVLFAPNKAAEIIGEQKKGDWLTETAAFPVVEATGETTAYGDYNMGGRAGLNANWPQRQAFLFQVVKQYGEREMERYGLAKINYVAEVDKSAALHLNKFANFAYFFGIAALQNYGLLNDPNLSASLTPGSKANGGVKWMNGTVINASANEVYLDIESIFAQLISQTGGLVNQEAKMTLAMSPGSEVALTATNSFNVNVRDLLKKNFPNMQVMTAVQYGAVSSTNPQGVAAGNFVQLILDEVEGQKVAFAAFNEKMRAHKIIPELSSYRQKVTAGVWGAIIRLAAGIAAMVGV